MSTSEFKRGFALGIKTALDILRTEESLGGNTKALQIALMSFLSDEEKQGQ